MASAMRGGRIIRLYCFLWVLGILLTPNVDARDLDVLYLGNSYTYFPGTDDAPGLPPLVQAIAESIDPNLRIRWEAHARGGYRFEDHLKDSTSLALITKHHDVTILQGNSIEALELTPWYLTNIGNAGVASFRRSLPKIVHLAQPTSARIVLFVNWAWNFKQHASLRDNHPGLRFPENHLRRGERWCGNSQKDFQKRINSSYSHYSRDLPVSLSFVGTEFLRVSNHHLVQLDSLYIDNDWSHPSILGSYVAALTLIRDALGLDIRKARFLPEGVNPARAKQIVREIYERRTTFLEKLF